MTVLKVNAGYVGPGQTAKTFTGLVETSTTEEVKQVLETVTAKVYTTPGTFKGVITEKTKAITSANMTEFKAILTASGALVTGAGGIEGNTVTPGAMPLYVTMEAALAEGTFVTGFNEAKKEVFINKEAAATAAEKAITAKQVKTLGKTLYITDILVSTDSKAEAATILDLALQASGVTFFRASAHQLVPIDMPGIETQPKAEEGKEVVLLLPKTAAKQKVWFYIAGFEQ